MLVSVIVPVYNAEKYLHRCINSILSQTYMNFELLLINDGSKDKSGIICDEYAAKDSRIRSFHKENGGASAARNYGLDKAIGEYICFIDADDWVEKKYIELLLPIDGEDMVLCAFICETMEKFLLSDIVRDKPNIEKNLHILIDHMAVCSPWCKVMRRDIIERNCIRFDVNVSAGEDFLFICDYFSVGLDKIRTISTPLYHYYISGNTSLSHKVVDLTTTEYVLDCIKVRIDKLSNVYMWNSDDGYKRHICTQFNNMMVYAKNRSSLLEYMKCIKRIIDNPHVRILLSDSNYLVKRKRLRGFKSVLLKLSSLLIKIYYFFNPK